MSQYTKNLLTAAGLSLLFIAAWDYFYAFPQMDRQRQQAIEQQKTAKMPKLGAPERRQPAALGAGDSAKARGENQGSRLGRESAN
jgi:YidC/Oxa1 family membrane protein insertase